MTVVPRTVLHGVDQSAPTPSLYPANANMGHRVWDERTMGTLVRDTNHGKWYPEAGQIPFLFDFSIHGGAVGTINLARVPAGFVCIDGMIDVITTLTSAADSATIALHIEAANDIVTATAISAGGNIWDAGRHLIVPVNTVATSKKKLTDGYLVMTIGVQAVTAGKFRGVLRGFNSTTY